MPLAAQTSAQIGAALEQTNLTWQSTGWAVGALVNGRADAMTATAPAEGARPVLQTTITGPAKLVFDWAVPTGTSGSILGLSVDGREVELETWNDLWRCIELQIPAGTHTVAWSPLPGTTLFLDKFIYDPGQTMGFVLAMGDGAEGVWAVHRGSFGQTGAAARDGLTSAAQVFPEEGGLATAYRLVAPPGVENAVVSWWQRMVPNGHNVSFSPQLQIMGDYSETYAAWEQRERVVPVGSWIKVEGYFMTEVPEPGALFMDDFTVEPLTLGRVLDTPGLTWTTDAPDGVSWRVAGGSAPGGADGLALAWRQAPYVTTLTTVLPGPGLFAFSSRVESGDTISPPVLEASLNGEVMPLPSPPDGAWGRTAVVLPEGASDFSLTARVPGEAGGGFHVDQGNLLTRAEPDVVQALTSAEALEVWVSKEGGVARDETVAHGPGATVCLTPVRGQVSEIVIALTGPKILSFFTRSEPGASLHASQAHSATASLSAPGAVWEMRTLQVPAGPQYVHLVAGAGKVWLCDLTIILPVPLAEALDAASNVPGAAALPDAVLTGGFAAQFPAGSGATGDDAVVFPAARLSSLEIPFATAPSRLRFRFRNSEALTVKHVATNERTLFSSYVYGPSGWRDIDLILPDSTAGYFIFEGRGVWLDQLRLDSISPRPWAEAGIPSQGEPATWQAFSNAGRNDGICAVSMGNGSSQASPLPLAVTGACDISGFWRRGSLGGPRFVFQCGPQVWEQTQGEWLSLHAHMDEPAAAVFTVESGYWWAGATGAEGMVEDVTITPQPAMSFSRAMETDAPGAALLSPGWTALGSAVPAVTGRLSYSGEDAIVVRPDPTLPGPQTTTLRARFAQSGFYHLRALRTGSSSADCSISWSSANGVRGGRDLALSSAWTLLRDCVGGSGETTLEIQVTVDGGDARSAVYLDDFAWEPVPDTSELLETAAFTGWASSPPGAWQSSCHVLSNGTSATGMTLNSLTSGTAASLTGTVTGPGFVVFSTADKHVPGQYTQEISVDGAVVYSNVREERNYGPDTRADQFFLPAGTHQVSWTIRADFGSVASPLRLLSVALVPGEVSALLSARLPATAGWRYSDDLPIPLYNLHEGTLTPGGIGLTSAGMWIERDITGPAEVNIGWYSDAGYYDPQDGGRFTINGHDGGTPHRNSYSSPSARTDITRSVSIPPGLHTFRWSRVIELPATVALGPCETGPPVISPEDAGLVIWINDSNSEFRWRSVTGRAFAGATALSARDTARGECLVNGPGILSFMLAQDGRSIFGVSTNEEYTWFYSSEPHDWEPVSLIIPPGPQRIRFTESYCEPTDGTEIAWIDTMKFTPGGFALWRASHLDDPPWGAGWQHLDSDGDGVTDEFEYAFNASAGNLTVTPGPTSLISGGQMQLHFPALPYSTNGLRYLIESSPNLIQWEEMARLPASPANLPGPVFTVPEAPRRYLRSRVLVE